MFANAYQGKKVFITGHTGFKGSWLAAWLLQLGAKVCGFAHDIPTTPANFTALNLKEHIQDVTGDIRDRAALLKALQAFQPDVVFHLAAQAIVRKSYADPVETFESNMLGTLNVLEAIRQTPSVQTAIIITSDKCYRNDEWVYGYRETDHLGGHDPYSASKGCAELIAHSYCQSFFQTGPACCTVRAGNVIGGGDWAQDRIVPDCARAWAAKEPVVLRNPQATRPWQHVLEPLSGYLWLGAKLLTAPDNQRLRGQAYNFGPRAEVCAIVREVVEGLALHWPNFQFTMEHKDPKEQAECTLLKLCCDKALAHLNWQATLNFEETLRYTAEWYHCFYSQLAPVMLDFTLGQIAAYVTCATQRGQVWTA